MTRKGCRPAATSLLPSARPSPAALAALHPTSSLSHPRRLPPGKPPKLPCDSAHRHFGLSGDRKEVVGGGSEGSFGGFRDRGGTDGAVWCYGRALGRGNVPRASGWRGRQQLSHQVEQLLELPELVEREVRVVLNALPQLLFFVHVCHCLSCPHCSPGSPLYEPSRRLGRLTASGEPLRF